MGTRVILTCFSLPDFGGGSGDASQLPDLGGGAGASGGDFPPEDNEIEVSMMPNAEFRLIKSDAGHLAGFPGFDAEADAFVDQGIIDLLKQV